MRRDRERALPDAGRPDAALLTDVMVRRMKSELPPDDLGRAHIAGRHLEAIEVDSPEDERRAHGLLVRNAKLRVEGARDDAERYYVLRLLISGSPTPPPRERGPPASRGAPDAFLTVVCKGGAVLTASRDLIPAGLAPAVPFIQSPNAAPPATNPPTRIYLYVEAGAWKARSAAGVVTTLVPVVVAASLETGNNLSQVLLRYGCPTTQCSSPPWPAVASRGSWTRSSSMAMAYSSAERSRARLARRALPRAGRARHPLAVDRRSGATVARGTRGARSRCGARRREFLTLDPRPQRRSS